VHITTKELREGRSSFQALKDKNTIIGDIFFLEYKEEIRHSFIQYLQGGL